MHNTELIRLFQGYWGCVERREGKTMMIRRSSLPAFREWIRGGEGTGLGLAIVKHVVDLHGGKVWIEDNPEGGSVFCVEIPKL